MNPRHSATTSRTVERIVPGQPTSDGAGVKLLRLLTPDLQRRLDPFLMLDAFGTDNPGDYIAGFPPHPHRGFETVTVMLQGRMRHRDSVGHEGRLEPGGVQWMTAGRGVIHSEMPEQADGAMEGFQFWLNLASRDKMQPADYRDLPDAAIPRAEADGVRLRVIAGQALGVSGAVQRPTTEPLLLDIELDAGGSLELPLDAAMNAFAVPYRGTVDVGGTAVSARRMAILANRPAADGVRLAAVDGPARLMFAAGRPLNEPIAQYGPFVMNSNDEIFQAVDDYRRGVLA